MISCGARLAPFDIGELSEIMSYDEMELDRMGDRKTATFFIISDTDTTYSLSLRWPFRRCFKPALRRGPTTSTAGRLPHHVRVLWDEAANTGQVPHLKKSAPLSALETFPCASCTSIWRNARPFTKTTAETILGNMDTVQFLGGRESSTIKEISENWLGKQTISQYTEGRTRGQSESYNQTCNGWAGS